MTTQEERTVEIKMREVAALAESLAEDLRNKKLWEGDCSKRLGSIAHALADALLACNNDR